MKIQVEFDLAVPRWVRNLGVALAPAALIVTAAVVRADVPNAFKDGDVLSADKMNQNFTSLDARVGGLEKAALATAGGPLRVEVAAIKGGTPPSFNFQSTPWLSVDIANSSQGYYQLDFTNAFSAVPVCVVTPSPSQGVVPVAYIRSLTATGIQIDCENQSGAAQNWDLQLICIGPK